MIDPHTHAPTSDGGLAPGRPARRGAPENFADTGRRAARRAVRNGNQREDADVT